MRHLTRYNSAKKELEDASSSNRTLRGRLVPPLIAMERELAASAVAEHATRCSGSLQTRRRYQSTLDVYDRETEKNQDNKKSITIQKHFRGHCTGNYAKSRHQEIKTQKDSLLSAKQRLISRLRLKNVYVILCGRITRRGKLSAAVGQTTLPCWFDYDYPYISGCNMQFSMINVSQFPLILLGTDWIGRLTVGQRNCSLRQEDSMRKHNYTAAESSSLHVGLITANGGTARSVPKALNIKITLICTCMQTNERREIAADSLTNQTDPTSQYKRSVIKRGVSICTYDYSCSACMNRMHQFNVL
ncbi:hypothetical protein M513_00086 [Trichuris suis]|uniref:Uncharacterized protein n=1 Tax=Trichuris suis TaxID=68888 RepID=A0A085MNX7_9BILA|nr:hypothetical protein M513_00086 [Trichuris suis]